MAQNNTTFSFNIMDAAGYGHYRVWKERAYLLKLALVPLIIKLAATIAVYALELEDEVLRQGFVMLPAMFAQGWVLAQWLRTLLMNERWPVMLPQTPDEHLVNRLINRARGIVSSVLVYVLIGLFAYVLRYVLMEVIPSEEEIRQLETARENAGQQLANDAAEDIGGLSSMLGVLAVVPLIAGIAAMVWAFRLFLLYIPFSVLMGFSNYMRALGGFMPSAKLLVLFFICMAPATFVASVLSQAIVKMTGTMADGGDTLAHFLIIFMSVCIEMVIALVTTAAFAWSMQNILPHTKDAMSDFPKLSKDD